MPMGDAGPSPAFLLASVVFAHELGERIPGQTTVYAIAQNAIALHIANGAYSLHDFSEALLATERELSPRLGVRDAGGMIAELEDMVREGLALHAVRNSRK